MLPLEYAIPGGYANNDRAPRRRMDPRVGRATSIALFAGALGMFVIALRLPAWYFSTTNFPDGGTTAHTWSGGKCLKFGFMFYPSNLLLICMSLDGLITTLLDWRRPPEKARGMPRESGPILFGSTGFVLVCGFLAGPLKTPGCGLWMASHLAYAVAVAIRVHEVLPYRRQQQLDSQRVDALYAGLAADAVVREGACPSGAPLNVR
jgi:hypothetical protein